MKKTTIEDRGTLKNTEAVSFYPDTFKALRQLAKMLQLFITTNQGGISPGITSHEQAPSIGDVRNHELRQENPYPFSRICRFYAVGRD